MKLFSIILVALFSGKSCSKVGFSLSLMNKICYLPMQKGKTPTERLKQGGNTKMLTTIIGILQTATMAV